MQKYPVRATARPRLSVEGLEEACRTIFGSATREEGAVSASFGALARLRAWPADRDLAIDVTMDPKVDDATQRETIRRYNHFLEQVTGYTAKERASRIRKAASKSAGKE